MGPVGRLVAEEAGKAAQQGVHVVTGLLDHLTAGEVHQTHGIAPAA